MTQLVVDDVESRRVVAALRAVLPPSAELRVVRGVGPAVELRVNGHRLHARWAGEGWLRQIRQILDEQGSATNVVVARRMSPGAREALGKAKIGWVDESGAAEIALGTLIVSRTGRPDAAVSKPAHWTPVVLAAAEALLCGTRATVSSVDTKLSSCVDQHWCSIWSGHKRLRRVSPSKLSF